MATAAGAAPYETVIVYSKTGAQGSPLLVTVEDLMTSANEDVTLPTEFMADDGSTYKMSAIRQQLDAKGVDKHYLAPFWDFSVSISVDNHHYEELDAMLSASSDTVEWQVPQLIAGSSATTHFVSIDLRGSYSAEYLCGLEDKLREKADDFDYKSYNDVTLTRDGLKAPTKLLTTKAKEPILFSFCDVNANVTDTIDWENVYQSLPKHHKLGFGHTFADHEALREAHKRALIGLLFGDRVGTPELDVLEVNAGAKGAPRPTNLVIHDHMKFTVASVPSLHAKEEQSSIFGSNSIADLSRYVDKDSRVTIDLSEFHSLCGSFFSAPYSVVLTTTDETVTPASDKKGDPNPVVIKAPLSGTCAAEIKAPWAQFVGRTFRIALLYQLPGSLGKVTVAATGAFKVRQLGLITTFPVVSEVVAAINGSDAGKLTSTSSIPISWAIRSGANSSVGYTAITIPWKFAWAARTETDTSKLFAFYAHVSIIIPVGDTPDTTRYALGVGVSLAEAFHFAWGVTTSDHANFFFIGLSPTDIVKLVK